MTRSEINRRYREKNAKKIAEGKARYRANPDNVAKEAEYARKYNIENKEKISARMKDYTKNNPKGNRERSSNYAARKSQRMPIWADRKLIKDIYDDCPDGMEVDHEIPLRGELVSGLHVPENLQYLTPLENQQKGNTYSQERLSSN